MCTVRIGGVKLAESNPDWINFACALGGSGYNFSAPFGNGSTFWNPNRIETPRHLVGGTSFVNGWTLNRCNLGRDRVVIGPLPRRLYFKQGVLDPRREDQILKGQKRPQGAPQEDQLKELQEILNELDTFAARQEKVHFELDTKIQDRFMIAGRSETSPASTRHLDHYTSHGFMKPATDSKVHLVWDDQQTGDRGKAVANDFAGQVAELKSRFKITTQVGKSPLQDLINRLDQIEREDIDVDPTGKAIVLLLEMKENNSPLTERMRSTMGRLDQLGIRWRRACYQDDRKWSVRTQLPSILEATGAIAHAIVHASGEALPWSIGIDLSHPKRGRSKVCAALIRPEGTLHTAWTCPHPRNETIEAKLLQYLLAPALRTIHEEDPGAGVLIVRDGRLFERENADFYRRDARCPVSLVEIRKSKNPIVFLPGTHPSQPACASIASFERTHGQELHLLTVHGGRGLVEVPLKITWRPEWDGLGLASLIPSILYAQTLTPGLGVTDPPRRLPAPIYWADGIAGASDHDLRFRGQPVKALKNISVGSGVGM